MSATQDPPTRPQRLKWKSQCGCQVASDDRCLYMREGMASMIAAGILCTGITGTALWVAVTTLPRPGTAGEKAFGGLMILIAALFIWVAWYSLRRGRWMVVYDRGAPGIPAEIRCREIRLPADRVRSLSTRSCGQHRSTVVAEFHDGTYRSLGPIAVSTWPAHYAHQAATWMGLPYRPSAS